MKKNIFIALLVLAVLSPSQGFAQDGAVINPIQKLREMVNVRKENRAERQEVVRKKIASTTKEVKARAEDAKTKLGSTTPADIENVKQKVNRNILNIYTRVEATIEREESIMAKINSRIEKIKALNGDTAEAEKLVAEAGDHLAKAKTSLQTLKTTATGVITEPLASSTKDAFPGSQNTLKKISNEIEKHLREAHQSLQKSIGSLKGVSQLKNASSTNSN